MSNRVFFQEPTSLKSALSSRPGYSAKLCVPPTQTYTAFVIFKTRVRVGAGLGDPFPPIPSCPLALSPPAILYPS
ncbi:hypothetical protein HGB47_19145 [Leptospira yasudae]|uniref:hypothetical protein n=1 Tax=Leptospira yasudae TaxID=2202201 RepID=UPI001C4F6EF8|nr:hypothetical protein [Leptospira yasudae]MBW0435726.1 hypothetical protein [Leptospira yasudae]